MHAIRRAAAVFVVLIGIGLGARAQAADTTTVGGTGGSPAALPCPPGELLMGIGARYGDDIDWLGPMCVKRTSDWRWDGVPEGGIYVPPAKKDFIESVGAFYSDVLPWNIPSTLADLFAPSPTPRPGMGTSSGGPYVSYALCPQDTYVSGFDAVVAGSGSGLVARMTLRCSGPGGATAVGLPPPNNPSGPPYYPTKGPDCPDRELASGLFGNSGVFVDKIGLTCVSGPPAFRRPLFTAKLHAQLAAEPKPGVARTSPGAFVNTHRIGAAPSPLVSAGRLGALGASKPQSQLFAPPRTADGRQLNACASLTGPCTGTDKVASSFCSSKGLSKSGAYALDEGAIASETLNGQRCNTGCKVFRSLTCETP